MLIELEVLNDVGVGSKDLTMMFDRNADDRLSRVFNFHFFHILLILEYMIRWFDQATVGQPSDKSRTWMWFISPDKCVLLSHCRPDPLPVRANHYDRFSDYFEC